MHAMTDESATTSTPRITNAMEDYLKAIYHLGGDGRPVTMQRLAEEASKRGSSP